VRLPFWDQAEVPEEKITKHLLCTGHRDGRRKAAFFMAHGSSPHNWESLAEALRQHAAHCDVVQTEGTPFGTRYVVEGPLQAPDGRNPLIRVVWFFEKEETVPRLVTAYPLK